MNSAKLQKSPQMQSTDCITLKLGDKGVQCSKKLLTRDSHYFKALFSGSFKDSTVSELDVSGVVESVEDLNTLICFIRERQVELTPSNLETILRIASYYMIEPLISRCIEYMIQTNSVANSVYYYLLSKAVHSSNAKPIKELIESRFHDTLITTESVLNLSEDELLELAQSGMMKYCSKESIFLLLSDWLKNADSITSIHLEIMQTVSRVVESSARQQIVSFESNKRKITAILNRIFTKHKALSFETKQQIKSTLSGLCVNKSTRIPGCTTELRCKVLFTFSERSIISKGTTLMPEKVHTKVVTRTKVRDPVLDLCVYNSSTKAWYHIDTFAATEYFRAVDESDLKASDFNPNISAGIFCKMEYIQIVPNEIWFWDISKRNCFIRYNFVHKTWQKHSVSDLTGKDVTHFKFVSDKCGILHLVTRCQLEVIENNQSVEETIQFCGYKLFMDSAVRSISISPTKPFLCCLEVFETSPVTVHRNMYQRWAEMTVKLSTTSRELLILNTEGSGDNIAFVVDLEENTTEDIEEYLIMHYAAPRGKPVEYLFLDVVVFETSQGLLVMSRDNDTLTLKYEYLFSSKTLSKVSETMNFHIPKQDENHMKYSNASEFANSYWYIESKNDLISFCKNIRFDSGGNHRVEEHTPPPFTRTVSVFAAEVDSTLFDRLLHVKHFLEMSGT